jgi:hypothetical protein
VRLREIVRVILILNLVPTETLYLVNRGGLIFIVVHRHILFGNYSLLNYVNINPNVNFISVYKYKATYSLANSRDLMLIFEL